MFSTIAGLAGVASSGHLAGMALRVAFRFLSAYSAKRRADKKRQEIEDLKAFLKGATESESSENG